MYTNYQSMRVVEPHQFNGIETPAKKSHRPKVFGALCAVVLLAGAVTAIRSFNSPAKPTQSAAQQSNSQSTTTAVEGATVTKTELKDFNGQEFKTFFEAIAYPNTVEVRDAPEITGNPEADLRIQALAVTRGYKLRYIAANQPLAVDEFYLQQKAIEPWNQLKAAAKADGHTLKIIAAFRSINDQRQLFLERLSATGVTASQIANGAANDEVVGVLNTTAPPGYSRHHSGFAVDLDCPSNPGAFVNTACFRWLSTNNYKNAKKFGWIPSYPNNATNQGPEPEPWEYTWVGQDTLLQ